MHVKVDVALRIELAVAAVVLRIERDGEAWVKPPRERTAGLILRIAGAGEERRHEALEVCRAVVIVIVQIDGVGIRRLLRIDAHVAPDARHDARDEVAFELRALATPGVLVLGIDLLRRAIRIRVAGTRGGGGSCCLSLLDGLSIMLQRHGEHARAIERLEHRLDAASGKAGSIPCRRVNSNDAASKPCFSRKPIKPADRLIFVIFDEPRVTDFLICFAHCPSIDVHPYIDEPLFFEFVQQLGERPALKLGINFICHTKAPPSQPLRPRVPTIRGFSKFAVIQC